MNKDKPHRHKPTKPPSYVDHFTSENIIGRRVICIYCHWKDLLPYLPIIDEGTMYQPFICLACGKITVCVKEEE